MLSECKVFCQRENREEEEEGGSKSEERKLKSTANCTACFLRAPLTARCERLRLSPCPCLSHPLWLPLSRRSTEKMWEREKRQRKRLVSTVMVDERERDRFCLVAHLCSFPLSPFPPSLSLFFLKCSCFHSLFLKTFLCSCLTPSHQPSSTPSCFLCYSLPKPPVIAF